MRVFEFIASRGGGPTIGLGVLVPYLCIVRRELVPYTMIIYISLLSLDSDRKTCR